MDIYCPICSEPWDMDTLHDEISERIAEGKLDPLPDHDNYNQSSPQYRKYREVYDGYYSTVRSEFYSKGCNALLTFMGRTEADWCVRPDKPGMQRGDAMSALADLMGDDLDGIASMMEDAEYMGMF